MGHNEECRCVWSGSSSCAVALVVLCSLASLSIASSTQSAHGQPHRLQHKAVLTPTVVSREIVQIKFQDLEGLFDDRVAYGDDDASRNRIDLTNVDEGSESGGGRLLQKIQNAFGPDGLGLLEITDLPPDMVELRQRLLPMAADLANLPPEELQALELPHTHYTIGWSHGKERLKGAGAGDYDLAKGSFYMNPFFDYSSERRGVDGGNPNVYPPSLQPQLEENMMKMTRFMTKVGLWIAQLCDLYLEQQERLQDNEHIQDKRRDARISTDESSSSSTSTTCQGMIYNSLKSCQTTKARLLYYFPAQRETQVSLPLYHQQQHDTFDDWCGWHKDHGSLTALLPGMLCGGDSGGGCGKPTNTYNGTTDTKQADVHQPGLYIQTRRPGELVHAQLSPTSLGFQLGETLEIMSRGRLRATPHAVKAPPTLGAFGMGRSSLAVFLQPTAEQKLPPLTDDNTNAEEDSSSPFSSLQRRWRPTFGAFQRATTEAFN